MTSLESIAALWGGVAAAAWIAALAAGLRASVSLVRVSDLRPAQPARFPSLSIVVAARDEADHLESSVESWLRQDLPDLEVFIVDDRSRDRTGEIADRLAARDPRVRVLHVHALPAGWLGKPHALNAGVRAARGEFVLFTDADVRAEPGILRKALAWCEERGVDHLALAPFVHSPGVLQEAAAAAFVAAFLLGTGAVSVSRPSSRAFVGVGAFNLVRRSVFDRTPGFDWLRMEVLDDVGLALMMHRAGARKDFAVALEELRITWYPSLGAMARGLEKNMYGALARYRVGRLAAVVAFFVASFAGLAVALAQPWSPLVRGLGIAAVVVGLVVAVVLKLRTRVAIVPLLLAPLGATILVGILLRSAAGCLRRGGIEWRGTVYPVAELRDGQRVEI
jgi:glycosyltransferase involved in cell wall biosynthesis